MITARDEPNSIYDADISLNMKEEVAHGAPNNREDELAYLRIQVTMLNRQFATKDVECDALADELKLTRNVVVGQAIEINKLKERIKRLDDGERYTAIVRQFPHYPYGMPA